MDPAPAELRPQDQAQPAVPLQRFIIELDTRGHDDIVDLTDAVQTRLRELPVAGRGGVLHLFVVGSTASLTTIEYEPGLVKTDLKVAMEKFAPSDGHYAHEATWHDDNGHSHVRSTLLGPSLSVPFEPGGQLMTGTWQQIVLVDFDTRPRRRTVIATVL